MGKLNQIFLKVKNWLLSPWKLSDYDLACSHYPGSLEYEMPSNELMEMPRGFEISHITRILKEQGFDTTREMFATVNMATGNPVYYQHLEYMYGIWV